MFVEEVEQEDEVHVLCRKKDGSWQKMADIEFQLSRKKDVVFQLHEIVDR
jgi:hypothetical protein